MANISIDQLANEIAKELKNYTRDVIEGIDKSSGKIANNAVKKLKSTSPKDTGGYAKGWRVNTNKRLRETNTQIIHNKNHYRLTHLLEYGHAKLNGGRVQAKPHIKQAEEEVIKEFTEEVERILRNGG